ncbi:MAG: cytochrome c, partial [Pseudomonadota bacterium]
MNDWLMDWTLSPAILNGLLSVLQSAQLGLLSLLHAIGLAPDVHGQPAWPFSSRIAGEMLLRDAGHARSVLASAACLALVLLALLVSIFWRRARFYLWGLALAALLLAPWPQASLLLTSATPTSFHSSQSGFTAEGIVRGQQLYQQACMRCHGADGRGEGPDAASLAMWPPTLNGSLLWKRLEGELFWHVRHGMQGRDGKPTMPGLGQQLNDAQVWELLDFLQAQAAGEMLKESGAWLNPVRLPDGPVRCQRSSRATARSLAGQRVRVAVALAGAPLLADDPRLVSLQLSLPSAPNAASAAADPECEMQGAAVATSLSLILGVPVGQLPGYQVIVDRQGWMRAMGKPGKGGWSEDDLICRSEIKSGPGPSAPVQDGLDGLIRRMDAEPVRLLRGGFP